MKVKVSKTLWNYLTTNAGVIAGMMPEALRKELDCIRQTNPTALLCYSGGNPETWKDVGDKGGYLSLGCAYRFHDEAVPEFPDQYLYIVPEYHGGRPVFHTRALAHSAIDGGYAAVFTGYEHFRGFEQELTPGVFTDTISSTGGKVTRVRLIKLD